MSKTIEVLERLSQVLGVDSDSSLSKELGVPRTTLSSWKNRDSVPYEQCIDIAKKCGVSLDWLLTGEGSMYKEQALPSLPVKLTTELMEGLDDDQKREIYTVIEEKKRLNRLMADFEELKQMIGKK